jgi:hypothetical protein
MLSRYALLRAMRVWRRALPGGAHLPYAIALPWQESPALCYFQGLFDGVGRADGYRDGREGNSKLVKWSS